MFIIEILLNSMGFICFDSAKPFDQLFKKVYISFVTKAITGAATKGVFHTLHTHALRMKFRLKSPKSHQIGPRGRQFRLRET